jgi:hypothetical protein
MVSRTARKMVAINMMVSPDLEFERQKIGSVEAHGLSAEPAQLTLDAGYPPRQRDG